MSVLRILINDSWPKSSRECHWYWCDGQKVLKYEYSDYENWLSLGRSRSKKSEKPKRLPCDVILIGGQVSCLTSVLPKGSVGRRREVIEGALEGQLIDNPSESLFLVLSQNNDGLSTIAVVNKKRIQMLYKFLKELRLHPRSIWGDGMLLPVINGNRCGRLSDNELILPTQYGGFISIDTQGSLPQFGWLSQVVASLPSKLVVTHHPDLAVNLRDVGQAAGLTIESEYENPSLFPLAAPGSGGFLSSLKSSSDAAGKSTSAEAEIVTDDDEGGKFFVLPMKILLFFVILLALMQIGQWVWLKREVSSYQSKINEIFQKTFANSAIVDAPLQMQQQLDAKRRTLGALGKSDFLTLMHQYLQIVDSVAATQVSYEGGQLRANVHLPSNTIENIRNKIINNGFSAEFNNKQAQGENTQAQLIILSK